MSGRQTKILHEQAERYGIPFGGRTISLPEVAKGLHDFLAANKHKLAAADEPIDPLLNGPPTEALERLRLANAQIAELELARRHGALVEREAVRTGLSQIAGILRSAGDSLQRQFGPEAHIILEEALGDATAMMEKLFSNDDRSD